MHQLILGATIPLTAMLVTYLLRHCRASLLMLIITPPLMAFGAIWAIAPDIPRILGMHALYEKLQTPYSNIFFWHYTIDRIEAEHLDAMTPLFNVCFALLLVLLLSAAWRELALREREGDN